MGNIRLQTNLFFNELSEENQQQMLNYGEEIEAKTGTVLFREGDKLKHIYLIRSGKVRLSKLTAEGKEFSVHLKQKDELVGETGLFNDMAITVTGEVIEDAILIQFDRHIIEKLFQENNEISITFMKWFAKYTQSTQAKFRDLILTGKTGALYSTLIRFSNSYGVKTEDGILINVQLTNQEIASYIGTTRENVNRTLNDLRKSNIISMVDGKIMIHDLQFLKDYLRCGDCPVEICII